MASFADLHAIQFMKHFFGRLWFDCSFLGIDPLAVFFFVSQWWVVNELCMDVLFVDCCVYGKVATYDFEVGTEV